MTDSISATQDALPAFAHIERALHALGYDAFRPGQREAVETLLQARRLLLVAPTGGGKSLCYQLPATLLSGTTVVISPLIALMHDQVHALERRGVAATFLASSLDSSELKKRMGALRKGAYKLAYVAPERLVYDGFRGLLNDMDVPLIAIDEAHCISEWGHDFRPEYMKIGALLEELPRTRVLACTATATPVVRDEILHRLHLDGDTPQIVRGFARPNLALSVLDTGTGKERQRAVDALLKRSLTDFSQGQGGTAIVYGPTRKSTEEEAARLSQAGWRAEAYHAGLDNARRSRVQGAFIDGQLQVVVATNAFGMGIDRADVRVVIHLAPPGSIESYYQEVGRAGRDGAPAWALMCTSAGDMPLRRSLLERGNDGAGLRGRQVVEHKWNLFLELMRWAEGGSCRHDAILRYFGDEREILSGCGRCDVCEMLAGSADATDSEAVQLLVRKALSAVARIHNRFGLTAAVQLLRGEDDERLQRAGLTTVKTFGILREHPQKWLLNLLRRCVTAGWVDFVGTDRPLAVLTEAGQAVMRGQQVARMLLPPVQQPGGRRAPTAAGAASSSERRSVSRSREAPTPELDSAAAALFEALRRHRLQVSQEAGVPPYVVASDRTLRDLVLLRPRNLQELTQAHGIGPAKAERFGPAFLQIIASN